MGRKSTAQPRPVLHVPPRGIGPIVDPNVSDVLCGRGGRINSHTGNIHFREVIASLKKDYLAKTTKKLEKAHIAAKIINDIRSLEPPGRFLKEDRETGLWFDIGDAKAIKKAGQALREDAPDIRPAIDGDSSEDDKDSSGDDNKKSPEKKSEDSAKASTPTKKAEKKSDPTPDLQGDLKNSTASASSPIKCQSSPIAPRQGQGFVSGRGAQHLPARNGPRGQQGNGAYPAMTPRDYKAQVAMPPPYSQKVQSYNGNDQDFQVPIQAQIPIQAPYPSQIYALPNQLYSGARSVGQRVTSASRHAMEALSQAQPPSGQRPDDYRPPDDIAFGRQFHPPSGTELSSGNTVSTISALSDPASSGIGMETGSGIVGQPMTSSGGAPTSRTTSLRLSQLNSMTGSTRSQLSNLQASRMSDLTGGSLRSIGRESLQRSFSFPDMNSVTEQQSWKAIMEVDEDGSSGNFPRSILSSGSSGRFSVSSRNSLARGDPMRGRTQSTASAMSISMASMSIGSGTSSQQWLAGIAHAPLPLDDDRSMFSGMSADLYALDLADSRHAL
jgi:hypothetical protein